ncbi:hypothetical protein AgCh_012553 [Apium graveolens]
MHARSEIYGHAVKSNCVLHVADEYCFETRDYGYLVQVVHTQEKIIADEDVMFIIDIRESAFYGYCITPGNW